VEPEEVGGTADLDRAPPHAFITHDHQVDGPTPHAHHRLSQELTSAS
jgi:hypothetical protein